MKKVFNYLFITILILSLCGCPGTEDNLDNRTLSFINNSSDPVSVILGDGKDSIGGGYIYPDTILPLKDMSYKVLPSQRYIYANILKYSQDSIYLFVLDPDTIAKYPWVQIREDYNIIKRYGLSWKKTVIKYIIRSKISARGKCLSLAFLMQRDGVGRLLLFILHD